MKKYSIEDLTTRLNSKNQANFIKLRINLREILNFDEKTLPDITILRYFIQNEYDVDITIKDIERHLTWKKESGIIKQAMNLDVAVATKPFFEGNFEMGYIGTSKKGQPIEILKFPNNNYWDILNQTKENDYLCYRVQLTERLTNIIWPLASEKYGKMIDGIILIVDLENLPIKQLLFDSNLKNFMRETAKIYDQNYPKIVKKTYIINCGFFFNIIWKFLKFFMNKEHTKTIEVLNSDFAEVLREVIDKEVLIKELGGDLDCKINDYKNFWDEEIRKSEEEKRFTFD